MILKQVIHYPDTNSVEAVWVDEEGKQVKCHSYADVQMDMLRADLGPPDAAIHANLITLVESNIRPAPSAPVIIAPVSPRQIRQALTALTLRDMVETAVAAGDRNLKDWWEFSTSYDRHHPLVVAIGSQLGVSPEQLDGLWLVAGAL